MHPEARKGKPRRPTKGGREYPTAGVPVTERRPDRDESSEKPEWNRGSIAASVADSAAEAFFISRSFIAERSAHTNV